ncbi:hypothetical protein OE88DRAFT_1726953 [Heliocybe sulcata]|uniref:Uncharacterized protein n=1 Tax=Heliocybe sulcata TaxID=5364 RepID=A0A5C3MY41_9AGAM|nr:hypothetical protein OE88DRAFT_1726953 [Heliocybe sulcata]
MDTEEDLVAAKDDNDDHCTVPITPRGPMRSLVDTTPESIAAMIQANSHESSSQGRSPKCTPPSPSPSPRSTTHQQQGTPLAQKPTRRTTFAGSPSKRVAQPLKPVNALRIVKRTGTKPDASTSANPRAAPLTRRRSIVVTSKTEAAAADADTGSGPARPSVARRPSVAVPPPRAGIKGVQRPPPGSRLNLAPAGKQPASVVRSTTGPARVASVQRPPVRRSVTTTASAGVQKQPPAMSGLQARAASMQKLSAPSAREGVPLKKSASAASKLPGYGVRSKIARPS